LKFNQLQAVQIAENQQNAKREEKNQKEKIPRRRCFVNI